PLDFLDFRDYLVPASGFQSVQFKEIEITLGLKSAQRLEVDRQSFLSRLSESERDYLSQLEAKPQLFELIEAWLERMPFLEFGRFRFWEAYGEAVDRMLAGDLAIIRDNAALTEAQRQRQVAGLNEM